MLNRPHALLAVYFIAGGRMKQFTSSDELRHQFIKMIQLLALLSAIGRQGKVDTKYAPMAS